MHYSVQPGSPIFITIDFLSFAKNMEKNNDKKLSKNLSAKYSQIRHRCTWTVSEIAIQKAAETIGDW